jgi:predicted metal-dependent peptidase
MKVYTAREKVQRARLYLASKLVFYGSIFFQLDVHEDPNCQTAYTNGREIGYNPDFLGALTIPQIVGVFVHEIEHIIKKHPLREAARPEYKANHVKWNAACDYAINPGILPGSGHGLEMDLPSGVLVDLDRWPDNLADEIFTQLSDEESTKGDGTGGPGGIGEVLPYQPESDSAGQSAAADGKSVPAAGGKPDPAAIEAASNQVDQWVQQAAMKAEAAGQMTSGLREKIRQIVSRPVDWESELELEVAAAVRSDYTWSRPNSRYMQGGTYLPSMTGAETADVLVFCDSSGSLSSRMLGMIATNLKALSDTFNLRLLVVYWDTKYQSHQLFDLGDELHLEAKGRGGTNFRKCWDWLHDEGVDVRDEFDIDPKCIIFFTDCQCYDWPQDDPDVPVVWCHVPDSHGRYSDSYVKYIPDHYGRTIKVPPPPPGAGQ